MPYTAPPTDDFDPNLPDDDLGTMPMDEVIREAINARLLGVNVCQPGRISAITSEQTVDVQLLLQTRKLGASSPADRPILQRVPVAMPMGAAYSVKLPLTVGDLGLVLFSDRSIDAYLASDGTQTVDPADTRTHSLNDAIFLPGLPTTSQNTADGTTDIVVSALPNGSQLRLRADGKLQLKNASQELLALVDQLIQQISTLITTTRTATVGPTGGPLLNAAAFIPIGQAVAAVQANLATLKV